MHSTFMSGRTIALRTRCLIFYQHKPDQLLWQYIMAYVHPPSASLACHLRFPSSRSINLEDKSFLPVKTRRKHHTIITIECPHRPRMLSAA